MITALELVAFTGVSVIAPLPLAVTPERTPITEDVQPKVVLPIVEVGRKLNEVPLQISWIRDVDEFVIAGLGLTVTTTSIKFPEQLLAEGVILYVTVPEVTPSVAVSTWLIADPLPGNAPVTFDEVNIVQPKLVPATPLGLVIAILVLEPEHIV
jgi:hypothetical protein